MDILKLSKYFFLVIIITSFLFCNDKTKKIEKVIMCNKDRIIHYYHNELSICFVGNIKRLDNKIEIFHIRNNKIISKLSHSKLKVDEIDFTILPELHTNDSLKIILKNNKYLYLHNFRNEPNYGGKNFLGCFFQSYMLNGKQKGLIDRHIIIVYIK